MSVAELMTQSPSTVAPEDTLATAASRMWEGDCGAIPVVDPEGTPLAMLTDRDVCMATWSRSCAPELIRVADVMSPRVIVCRASDTVEIAQSAMRMAQVRRLPVVDEHGRIVGVISLADMARAHEHADRQKRERDAEGLASTLASICRRTPESVQAQTEVSTHGPAAA